MKIFDILYLDEITKNRFTSDFRDVVTVLAEGTIDKRHDFQRLKYPVDALDMLYTYTKDEHYLDIRNQIIKKEQEGKCIKEIAMLRIQFVLLNAAWMFPMQKHRKFLRQRF